VTILQHSIPKTIEISCRYKADRYNLTGDHVSLQNAMLNLGINARDAMRDGGTLTFESENISFTHKTHTLNPGGLANGDYLLLRISDTGTGMDAKTVARIFEPFYTTKESGKGTGMGLSSNAHIPPLKALFCGLILLIRNDSDIAIESHEKSPAGAMWPRS
jgi:signal transduction histidine kinase